MRLNRALMPPDLRRKAEEMDRRQQLKTQAPPLPTEGTSRTNPVNDARTPGTPLQTAREQHWPQPAPAQHPGDVLAMAGMTPTSADRLASYFARAVRHGYATDDAEHIANLLQMRDRTGLDMGMCIECNHLRGRHCAASAALKAASDWMPVRHELVRCPLLNPIEDHP